MEPLSYRHWILFEGRRSTSANRAALSACTLGTFSHTSCFRIDCTLAGLSLRQLSTPSKLYRRQEHFRVLAKFTRVLCHLLPHGSSSDTAVDVCQSRFALRLAFLGHPRALSLYPISCTLRVCFLDGICESSPRHISTGRLHALRRFHSPPINLIVFEVPYRITP